jgi:hypothetical protein
MKVLLCFSLSLICLCACQQTRQQSLSDKEITDCAWLIEDICHALPRVGAELVTKHSSMAQLNIASWLANGDLSVQQRDYPLHLQKRREQWLIISQGLRDKSIISLDNGRLQLADDIDPIKRDIFKLSVETENQMRSNIDRIALQHAGLAARSERAQALLLALRAARVHLDRHLEP